MGSIAFALRAQHARTRPRRRCMPSPCPRRCSQVSAGGLVSALMGVGNFQTKWIGWPGAAPEHCCLPAQPCALLALSRREASRAAAHASVAARRSSTRSCSEPGSRRRPALSRPAPVPALATCSPCPRVALLATCSPPYSCLFIPAGVYIEAGPERDELTSALHSEGYSPVYLDQAGCPSGFH